MMITLWVTLGAAVILAWLCGDALSRLYLEIGFWMCRLCAKFVELEQQLKAVVSSKPPDCHLLIPTFPYPAVPKG